jgi:hypothetical protein
MDKVIFIPMGYYHPSQANWNYNVHLVIDATGARMYKENFGGDSRIIAILEAKGIKCERMHAGVGSSPKHSYKDIARMADIEHYTGKNWGN